MVATFGFSAGDFIAATKVIITIFAAFKETGGASEKYSREAAYLRTLNLTLQRLESLINGLADDDGFAKDLLEMVEAVQSPLQEFQTHLSKYDKALCAASTEKMIRKWSKTTRYTLHDMAGMVERLRTQIEQPLQTVNLRVSLRILENMEEASSNKNVLTPTQSAQLVKLLELTETPSNLETTTHQTSTARDYTQLRQLDEIQDLCREINAQCAEVQRELDTGQREVFATLNQQNEAEWHKCHRSVEKLEEIVKGGSWDLRMSLQQQNILLHALKTLLVGSILTARKTRQPLSEEPEVVGPRDRLRAASISIADIIITVFSGVIGSVLTLFFTRPLPPTQPLNLRPPFIPNSIGDSYPNREPVDTVIEHGSAYQPEAADERFAVSTQVTDTHFSARVRAFSPERSRTSVWVSDFSSSAGMSPEWSHKISKLAQDGSILKHMSPEYLFMPEAVLRRFLASGHCPDKVQKLFDNKPQSRTAQLHLGRQGMKKERLESRRSSRSTPGASGSDGNFSSHGAPLGHDSNAQARAYMM